LEILDGLRLIAALSVVLFHYVALPASWPDHRPAELFSGFYPIAAYGWLGVELFFLISGFVICMSAWGRSLGDFFASRVARLYPAYWVAVVLTAGVLIAIPTLHPRPPTVDILTNLTMLEDPLRVPRVSNVYWTLWIELHFYVLFAVAVWRGLTYRRVVAFCALWTVASVISASAAVPALNAVVDPSGSSPYFVAGVAMYLMYRYNQNLLLWGIVGMSWLLALHSIKGQTDIQSPVTSGVVTWRVTAMIITGIFAIMLAVSLGMLTRIRGRWLTVAGALTYPLYLLHLDIGVIILRRLKDLSPVLAVFGVLAGMLVASWLLHVLVERPLQPLLRRYLRQALDQMRTSGLPRQASSVPGIPIQGQASGLPVLASEGMVLGERSPQTELVDVDLEPLTGSHAVDQRAYPYRGNGLS
jgi:peptidoglycan/LPS O-acetylase OafA/YrhL